MGRGRQARCAEREGSGWGELTIGKVLASCCEYHGSAMGNPLQCVPPPPHQTNSKRTWMRCIQSPIETGAAVAVGKGGGGV
jgi:hypothetical protein